MLQSVKKTIKSFINPFPSFSFFLSFFATFFQAVAWIYKLRFSRCLLVLIIWKGLNNWSYFLSLANVYHFKSGFNISSSWLWRRSQLSFCAVYWLKFTWGMRDNQKYSAVGFKLEIKTYYLTIIKSPFEATWPCFIPFWLAFWVNEF